ncbi:Hypothetical protein NGAL_HAMBI1146_58380 [Neorhizobium galegae bv. officinalis]|nr:Hypothetical protein NGAL_HAMBI1146_58380 [Neorhizobium galegae bv. officinalis]
MKLELIEKLDALRASLSAFDVRLPLSASIEDIGSVLDADGNDVFVVDHNNERADADVKSIAELIVNVVNASAGFVAGVQYKVEDRRVA